MPCFPVTIGRQYDENGFCVNDELKNYLKENVYLNSNQLNFADIEGEYHESW
jgi:hypothetical protein